MPGQTMGKFITFPPNMRVDKFSEELENKVSSCKIDAIDPTTEPSAFSALTIISKSPSITTFLLQFLLQIPGLEPLLEPPLQEVG